MSMINDALRRTRQAQQSNPPGPAPGPQLRPPELPRQENKSPIRWWPVLLVAGLIAGGLLLWRTNREGQLPVSLPGQTPVRVNARVVPPPTALPPELSSALAQVNDTDHPSATAAEAPPAGPAPLKLQAIFYQPARPSAIISGQTAFVGDWVGGFQVHAISANSVTLVGATGFKTLKLE